MVKLNLDDVDVFEKGDVMIHMFNNICYCLKKIKYVLFKGWF